MGRSGGLHLPSLVGNAVCPLLECVSLNDDSPGWIDTLVEAFFLQTCDPPWWSCFFFPSTVIIIVYLLSVLIWLKYPRTTPDWGGGYLGSSPSQTQLPTSDKSSHEGLLYFPSPLTISAWREGSFCTICLMCIITPNVLLVLPMHWLLYFILNQSNYPWHCFFFSYYLWSLSPIFLTPHPLPLTTANLCIYEFVSFSFFLSFFSALIPLFIVYLIYIFFKHLLCCPILAVGAGGR